jgi:cytochrome P450
VADRPLADSERMMSIMNIVTGGIETTIQAMGNIAYHLATRPDLRARLKAEPSLIPAAVEEFLRFESPAPIQGRATTCPVRLGTADIQAGERVVLHWGCANRDPAAYDRPDEIVLDRFVGEAKPHMTFGIGAHHCPGAHFARLELKVAVEEMLARMPDLELVTDDVEYRAGLTWGPIALPVRFSVT